MCLKCLRMVCRAETCSVYWRNWQNFVVVESSTYVDFDVAQRDECHKNYYTPRLEQHSFITMQNIHSPSWRYNLARLYIPLYLRLPEDGDLSLKHVGGFVFMDNVQFCAFYAHMLVYINDYKSTGIDFVYLNLVNIMKCATLFSRTTPQKPKRGLYKNWNLLGWPCVVSTAI